LTDELIREAERELDVQLPAELLDLLRIRNGGVVADAWNAFPTAEPTSWSPDHVPFDTLIGIGQPRPHRQRDIW
jgi:SMI1-KNR4 cell-wall